VAPQSSTNERSKKEWRDGAIPRLKKDFAIVGTTALPRLEKDFAIVGITALPRLEKDFAIVGTTALPRLEKDFAIAGTTALPRLEKDFAIVGSNGDLRRIEPKAALTCLSISCRVQPPLCRPVACLCLCL
jgi:hypothetical protein